MSDSECRNAPVQVEVSIPYGVLSSDKVVSQYTRAAIYTIMTINKNFDYCADHSYRDYSAKSFSAPAGRHFINPLYRGVGEMCGVILHRSEVFVRRSFLFLMPGVLSLPTAESYNYDACHKQAHRACL